MTAASPLDVFRGLSADQIAEVIERLSPQDVLALEATLPAPGGVSGFRADYPWQQPPDGDWWGWAITGGRGSGKTAGAAAWVNREAERLPGVRVGIIAPTLGDARATSVEGETGLLAVNPRIKFNRGTYEGRWPNGSTFRCFGAYTPEDRERLRGPQWHLAWLEEFASWRQLDEEPQEQNPDAWQHISLALRLGEHPRFVMTSTPKRRRRYKEVVRREDVTRTHGTTYEAHGLAGSVRARLLEMYEGTRLGRQELLGEELDDVEGAGWTTAGLDRTRVSTAPALHRIVVGVDPAGSAKSGTTGIVAAGASEDRWPHPHTGRLVRHGYVLADVSQSASPERWATAAVELYHALSADRIVAERNYGGDMVESTIRTVDGTVPVKMVNATRGKKIRAEPVAGLSAQQLLHMVGKLIELEDELTTWTEGEPWSPNRLDAMVWAVTDLLPDLGGRQDTGVEAPSGSREHAAASALSRRRISR